MLGPTLIQSQPNLSVSQAPPYTFNQRTYFSDSIAQLQPQQQILTQSLQIPAAQQQPQQLQITQNAVAIQQQTDFAKLVKFYQERPPLTKQQSLELLASQTQYLKNKVWQNFQKQIYVKQTQYLLIDTLSNKVSALFVKFGLNERNIEYQSDELQRLRQRIQSDQQKQSLLYQSLIKVKEFPNSKINSYLELNESVQKNKNVFLTFVNNEILTKKRQSILLKSLLLENKQDYGFQKMVVISSQLTFNTHSQIIIEKLFQEQGFYEKLQQYLEFQKIIKTGVYIENAQYYENLFKCFVDIQSDHKEIMKLLAQQFQSIEFQSGSMQADLMKNSVSLLEQEMNKKVGVFDLANLNQKFKDIYLDKLSREITLRKEGQYYPSGILFLLMRCGQMKSAKLILQQFLRQNKFNQFFELLEDKTLDNSQKQQQLDQICDDDLFEQCYLIAFDSGQVHEVFEKTHFQLDSDLFLWITLKTTHATAENCRDNWCLKDLQESIPKNIGYRMDIILLRYDEVLKEIMKNSGSLISKLEYFTLYFIVQSILNTEQLPIRNDFNQIQTGILSLVFEKYPEIGGLLIMLIEQDSYVAVDRILTEMKKYKYSSEMIQNPRLSDSFDQIFGNNQLTSELLQSYVQYQFEKNLIEHHRSFIENTIKSKSMNDLLTLHKAFVTDLDHMMEELKSYIQCRKTGFNNLTVELYYLSGIVLIIGECQFNLKSFELRQIQDIPIKGFQKNMHNPKQFYNFFSTIYQITTANSRIRQLYDFLQAFNFLIQSNKIEQFNLEKFRQYCCILDASKLSQILISKKQIYLFKLFFWMAESTLDITGNELPELKSIKDQYNKTITRQKNLSFNIFYLINEELELHFQDIKSMPQ